ncbi:MAG: DUF4124 domain-containing protein [Myxococcota bacterium]
MRLLVLALVIGVAAPVGAQAVVYKWADKNGVIHFTDDISQVPEPYASMYQARIREIEKRKAEAVGDRREPLPDRPERSRTATPKKRGPSTVEQIRKDQKKWQDRVAEWRTRLEQATASLERIEQKKAQLTLNPILRTTPQAREKIDAVNKERDAALKRVARAKKMLLETIPEEARKARVPYQWIL